MSEMRLVVARADRQSSRRVLRLARMACWAGGGSVCRMLMTRDFLRSTAWRGGIPGVGSSCGTTTRRSEPAPPS